MKNPTLPFFAEVFAAAGVETDVIATPGAGKRLVILWLNASAEDSTSNFGLFLEAGGQVIGSAKIDRIVQNVIPVTSIPLAANKALVWKPDGVQVVGEQTLVWGQYYVEDIG